jgi:hypothetical protein
MHLRRFDGGGGTRRQGCVIANLPDPVEPIKLKKRRSLSISPGLKKQRVNNQVSCALFKKLPAEIRMLIYRQVLKSWGWSERMHILRKRFHGDRESLSSISCRVSSDEEFEAEQSLRVANARDPLTQANIQQYECCWTGDLNEYKKSGLAFEARSSHLSLFLTCRMM